jgi:peptidoglycan/LPS O-acetylase OafA/YrhL
MPHLLQSERFQSIDCLRAIAALVVVYAHALTLLVGDEGDPGATFLIFVNDVLLQRGQLGVTVFFIISGYVIPYSLIAHRSGNLRKFAVSRFMRLYPAYWLSAGFFVLLMGWPADERVLWLNMTMVQRLFSVPDMVGIYWTLFVELIFYGMAALLFAVGWLAPGQKAGRVTVGAVVLTVIAALARRFMDAPLPAGTMMFLCLMFFGTWLRLGVYDGRRLARSTAAFLIAMLACAWLLYYPDRFGEAWYLQYGRFFLAVVIFLVAVKVVKFNLPWLAYLGAISYSIYLFHQPIIAFIGERMNPDAEPSTRLLMFGAALVVIIVVAALVYHTVERPFISMGKVINRILVPDLPKSSAIKATPSV